MLIPWPPDGRLPTGLNNKACRWHGADRDNRDGGERMLNGKTVKIRFKRNFAEQKLWVFIGKVLEFTNDWVTVEGRGLVIFKGRQDPVDIDEDSRVLVVPRENIAHIRILPDNFDFTRISTKTKGFRLYVQVPNGPDTSISE
jgi:hypothetical protein